ncbi:MAG: glycosyltransferase [Thermoproteus sp.]
MKVVVGIPTFNRPDILRISLPRLAASGVDGLIVVADAVDEVTLGKYRELINDVAKSINDVIYDLNLGRRGSVNARNKVLELFLEHYGNNYAIITYDDDYIPPKTDWIRPALAHFRDANVGIVGGKVINLRRRRVDPDFSLNVMPYLADVLTEATGFIFLDTKHGPRTAKYVTHLMAIRREVIERGVRYDTQYKGTGYREESDLQERARKLGYRIIFEPNFYTYHANLEYGGDRSEDKPARFYWKARNNTYFMLKNQKPKIKLILSTYIILAYAMINGPKTAKNVIKGIKDGYGTFHETPR